MNSFTLTKRAKVDLRDIAKFTEKRWGRAQRNMYIKQFDDTFHMLADSPTVGQDCNYIKQNYQKFPQGSHIIFYQPISHQNIQIIRILHKHMDVNTRLGSS